MFFFLIVSIADVSFLLSDVIVQNLSQKESKYIFQNINDKLSIELNNNDWLVTKAFDKSAAIYRHCYLSKVTLDKRSG